jgi:hypothetical protein
VDGGSVEPPPDVVDVSRLLGPASVTGNVVQMPAGAARGHWKTPDLCGLSPNSFAAGADDPDAGPAPPALLAAVPLLDGSGGGLAVSTAFAPPPFDGFRFSFDDL